LIHEITLEITRFFFLNCSGPCIAGIPS